MEFRLKVFKQVAEEKSLTKAAGKLFISQPAVSRHIAELEKEYGVPLVVRTGAGIKLTKDGEILYRYSLQTLNLYSELNDYFFSFDNRINDNITIGASSTIAQYIAPRILAELKKIYPSKQFSLLNGNTSEIEKLVTDKKVDFGLIEGSRHNPGLHYEPFILDKIVLATNSQNNILSEKTILPEKLKKLSFVMRESGSGTLEVIISRLQEHNLNLKDLNIVMTLGSSESIKNYLDRSEAFSFISISAITNEITSGKLKIINIEGFNPERYFYFIRPQGESSNTYSFLKKHFLRFYN